jgi:hypothetical protein
MAVEEVLPVGQGEFLALRRDPVPLLDEADEVVDLMRQVIRKALDLLLDSLDNAARKLPPVSWPRGWFNR